jgi:glycosidase
MTHSWRQDPFPKHSDDPAASDIVYVILPDRYDIQRGYDPAVNLKRFHPEAIFRPWNELPKRGPMNEELGICEHEREFWGGTLQGITGRLGYIK